MAIFATKKQKEVVMFLLSPEAGTLLALVIIVVAIASGIKKAARGLSSSSYSCVQFLKTDYKYSPEGKAEVLYYAYYKTNGTFVASVSCKKLRQSAFLEAKTQKELNEKIEQQFREFDQQAAEK